MSHITAIGTANPPHRFTQTQIADFMVRAMQLSYEDSRRLRAIFNASGIAHRHSVLDDYGRDNGFTFYSNAEDFEPFPSTAKRLETFRKHALTLSTASIRNMLQQRPGFDVKSITHLIVVCCTGMYAPGLDVDLVKALGLSTQVQRTGINFMGCYAAFNAMKVADAFCKSDPHAKVLVVCTELCSLHFQKVATDDNLLANALFADGSAALLMEAQTTASLSLRPESFCNELAMEGENDMAWAIGDLGFEMKLSTYVPDIIKSGIARLTASLLERIDKQLADIQFFAIHPGGKKILESIEQALGLDKIANEPAYRVLNQFGNMSSPTVLFVLHDIVGKLTHEHHGQHILSFAFGPGLTLESMILKIETH
ncbi:type III polyketide synthase [Chryseolinea lacunae]|uniref:Type III polyketide synthase n=1 Tax=Chryseolinea lacunae TaxID=2801331 RepID=A0ABS1KQU4_9BACT|nr:type III polyketide synthase [Chryseolinea lacunae]MBL0741683.1 type III polyketide synthase [Chryseolinea lacunae]